MKKVHVNIPGVCNKYFDLDNDLRSLSYRDYKNDNDLEYLYYESSKVVSPNIYVKVNNNLVSTSLSIEDMIKMQ